MKAYRLIRAEYAAMPLSPAGAREHGGRWNSPGVPAVYAAASISLALLEILVHLPHPEALAAYRLCQFSFDERDVDFLADPQLPVDWRRSPFSKNSQELGDAWIERAAALALSLPSAVVPQERIFLINPLHPGFADLAALLAFIDTPLDPRLLRR